MTRPGRHFLQIPGPTNVPDRVLRAMDQAVIDHRGPEFAALGREVLDGMRAIFQTRQHVVIYPSSGTGACEAALTNVLAPGDRLVVMETGWFSHVAWRQVAERLGLQVDYVPGAWRRGASPDDLEGRLATDRQHEIKAVVVVHNETSTGVVSRIADLRAVMNRLQHPALLMVDAVSSLGSIDFRFDEWGVDVAVSGSQKGLMVPPGLGFNAVSEKALAVSAKRQVQARSSYWDWHEMIRINGSGYFPYTPATTLLYGLREAVRMLQEEGLDAVFHRHARFGEATRDAVRAWGLDIVCEEPREYSNVTTAVLMPDGHDADRLRRVILERFDMSLGTGLGKLAGRAFRIGHLGSLNDLMLVGTLGGVEMGFAVAGVPHREGGVGAALKVLAQAQPQAQAPAPAQAG
jgi:alanine-glyoxylate transaminase/serine-glyoxylate transaminase/serine-pyruvate transaminase